MGGGGGGGKSLLEPTPVHGNPPHITYLPHYYDILYYCMTMNIFDSPLTSSFLIPSPALTLSDPVRARQAGRGQGQAATGMGVGETGMSHLHLSSSLSLSISLSPSMHLLFGRGPYLPLWDCVVWCEAVGRLYFVTVFWLVRRRTSRGSGLYHTHHHHGCFPSLCLDPCTCYLFVPTWSCLCLPTTYAWRVRASYLIHISISVFLLSLSHVHALLAIHRGERLFWEALEKPIVAST